MTDLKTRPLSYAIGAELLGADLTRPLDEAVVKEIRQIWAENLILLIRGQDLSPEQLIAFSRGFGTLSLNEHAAYGRDDRTPEILVVSTKPVNGQPSQTRHTGRNWHSDGSHTLRPSMGSLLHCRELPEIGGDTLWANMYLAYERLSAPLQRFLESLSAVHDIGLVANRIRNDSAKAAETAQFSPPVVHPVVRFIPETGRKALYLSDRVRQFVGMTEAESKPLLNFLREHSTSPELYYRHQWRQFDLMMWDNRASLHYALADFDLDQPRHMLRTTVLGEYSGQLLETYLSSSHKHAAD